MLRTLILAGVVGLCFLSSPGCGSKPKAVVQGTVKYKGELLQSGEVHFIAEDAQPPRSSLINPDGTYLIDDAPVGNIKIAVVAMKQVALKAQGPTIGGRDDQPLIQKNISAIPPKYNDPKTSGLSLNVDLKKQSFNIELPD